MKFAQTTIIFGGKELMAFILLQPIIIIGCIEKDCVHFVNKIVNRVYSIEQKIAIYYRFGLLLSSSVYKIFITIFTLERISESHLN